MRLRFLMLIPELILLYFFVMPITKRICNPGNILGILVCLLLMVITIIPSWFGEKLRHLWNCIGGKIGLIIAAVLLIAAIVFCSVMSVQMVRAIYHQPETPQTVVVLGCKVKGTKPSLMLTRRLKAAKTYLEEHSEVLCVVTGGQGSGEDISEGQAMKSWLVENGIAQERILVEKESRDTEENLRNTAEILKMHGLANEVVIVTDGFHEYRAGLLAEKEGLVAYAYPAKTRALFVPTYWVREWMALFQLFVFGHG